MVNILMQSSADSTDVALTLGVSVSKDSLLDWEIVRGIVQCMVVFDLDGLSFFVLDVLFEYIELSLLWLCQCVCFHFHL